MDEGTVIFISAMGAAFLAGLALAAIILLSHAGRKIRHLKSRRPPVAMNDTWENARWREM
jgi:hypothetical protein